MEENKTDTYNEGDFFKDYTNLIMSVDKIAKTKAGYGYTYLELTPLLDIVLPKLTENNFMLLQTVKQTDGIFIRDIEEPSIYEEKNEKKEIVNRVTDGICKKHIQTPAFVLNSKLVHVSGKVVECNLPLYVDDIDPQAIGSAETYMRRYAIYALLNIRVIDNDGLEASPRGKQNKKEQESKKPLPDDLSTLGTFLMSENKPTIYYHDIKDLADKGLIEPKYWEQLKKIMYPK